MQEYNTILVPHFLKLNAVLLESPHLASYVQSLVLQFGNATITEALNDVTASIVQQLSNVNSLSLSFVFWDRFSLPLQVALKDIFRAPSLTRVTLYEFSIPTFHELASLLSHATHLKALCVQVDCGYDMPRSAIDAIGATSFPPRSIQLDRLQFGQSFANIHIFLAWFQKDHCSFEVRNLQSLQIQSKVASEMLQYLGRNLRNLELLNYSSYINNVRTTDIPFFEYTPNLRGLTLGVYQTDLSHPAPGIMTLFKPWLNQDEVRMPLQHLTINIGAAGLLSIDNVDPDLLWAAFDKLLEKKASALLETVKIAVACSQNIPIGGIREAFRRTLTFLEGSGKLQVEECGRA